MTRLQKEIVYSINRIRTKFEDDIGNSRPGIGTGFWVNSKAQGALFITNKHNLDPKLKFPDLPDLKVNSVEVEVRRCEERNGKQVHYQDTRFFLVNDFGAIRLHETADCALIVAAKGLAFNKGYEPFEFPDSYLADAAFIEEQARMMDQLSFVGFPGTAGGIPFWDQEWNLPVARQAIISSLPGRAYAHRGIGTGDAMLVSGLSFSGSSGSPVFFHEIGERSGFGTHEHVPDRIVGIMSGHWWTDDNVPEVFRQHSGFSYLTSSRSILELIDGLELRTSG